MVLSVVAIILTLAGIVTTVYFNSRSEKDRERDMDAKRALLDYGRPLLSVMRSPLHEQVDYVLPDGKSISQLQQADAVDVKVAFDVLNHGLTYAENATARVKLTVPEGWEPVRMSNEVMPGAGYFERTFRRIAPGMGDHAEFSFTSRLTADALKMLELTRNRGTLTQWSADVVATLLSVGRQPPNTLKVDIAFDYDDAYGRHHHEDYCWFEAGTANRPYEKCTADVLNSPVPTDPLPASIMPPGNPKTSATRSGSRWHSATDSDAGTLSRAAAFATATR